MAPQFSAPVIRRQSPPTGPPAGNRALIAADCRRASESAVLTGSGWPDLITAIAMASLFLSSAVQILRRAHQKRHHPDA